MDILENAIQTTIVKQGKRNCITHFMWDWRGPLTIFLISE